MSTSKTHTEFVGEPMKEKPVTKLPGIGPTLGNNLNAKGIIHAYTLLGLYLTFGKNKELFVNWLKIMSGANNKQATDCHDCLKA